MRVGVVRERGRRRGGRCALPPGASRQGRPLPPLLRVRGATAAPREGRPPPDRGVGRDGEWLTRPTRRPPHRALRRPRGSDRIGELFSLFRERDGRTDEGAGEGATEVEGGSGRGCKLLRHTTHSPPLLVHPPTPHSRRRQRRRRANGGTVIAEGEGGIGRTEKGR